jgi:hypothetical protein
MTLYLATLMINARRLYKYLSEHAEEATQSGTFSLYLYKLFLLDELKRILCHISIVMYYPLLPH